MPFTNQTVEGGPSSLRRALAGVKNEPAMGSALSPSSYVTLGKFHHLSKPWFPHL